LKLRNASSTAKCHTTLPPSAVALLRGLAKHGPAVAPHGAPAGRRASAADAALLVAADLAQHSPAGLKVTAAGQAFLRRRDSDGEVDAFRAQHLSLARQAFAALAGTVTAIVDEAESPLVWLAGRKTRDGQPLIEPTQLLAGERLRKDFTVAQLAPRLTMNLDVIATHEGCGPGDMNLSDTVVAARQRVRAALAAVGPELAGLVLDVCCFLKRLEDVERERRWSPGTARIVLQLGLDRLARHYGLAGETRGRARGPLRAWRAAAAGVED
jgi:uncharacterized protein DUF6456